MNTNNRLKKIIATIGITSIVFITSCNAQNGISKNGFDLSNASIGVDKILSGGPGKDGIPAIDNPVFVTKNKSGFIKDTDRVLALEVDGVAKAYPINILNWHEIVNDKIGDKAFAVTYCPLCGTGAVFSSNIKGKHSRFGVSGLLYNSDVLLYDDQTESLFSQILSKAISGPLVGEDLTPIVSTHTTWGRWKALHPNTLVLSTATGHVRDYTKNPYGDYGTNRSLYFPAPSSSPDANSFHPKETVIGLKDGDQIKAYPFSELDKNEQSEFTDLIDGKAYTILWDSESKTAQIKDQTGNVIPTIQGFYFAWIAFYPDSLIYKTK
ncbi:MAG: DUF3179 domain-containing protein [Candidatus Ruthia sp.]|nr:DUF3179 domain-containing protein [Candidatus Ruthturnera sp.]MBT4668543.1 DUF3179 domain-containing protein [Candidatus Ruthturnera sp.]